MFHHSNFDEYSLINSTILFIDQYYHNSLLVTQQAHSRRDYKQIEIDLLFEMFQNSESCLRIAGNLKTVYWSRLSLSQCIHPTILLYIACHLNRRIDVFLTISLYNNVVELLTIDRVSMQDSPCISVDFKQGHNTRMFLFYKMVQQA